MGDSPKVLVDKMWRRQIALRRNLELDLALHLFDVDVQLVPIDRAMR